MRVFLDIGAHEGETVAEVVKKKYAFDRIVCFEPSIACQPKLLDIADSRVELCHYGLAGANGTAELHHAGTEAGSIYGDGGASEKITLIDAARWFSENLTGNEFLVVKTNCEGAEVDIINRLLDAGLFDRAVLFLVTFDIRNYPDQRHREVELRRRLRGARNHCFADDVMIGLTHQARVAHWLSLFGIDRPELSAEDVRRLYADAFAYYSTRSGWRERMELRLKERFGYGMLPEPIKHLLRWGKRAVGLSRERAS